MFIHKCEVEVAQNQYQILTRPPQNLEMCFEILKQPRTHLRQDNNIQYIHYIHVHHLHSMPREKVRDNTISTCDISYRKIITLQS